MDYEEWRRGYKRENDTDFAWKVSEVRKATGRPVNHCSWMIQICSGDWGKAIKLLDAVGYRVWC